MRKLGKFMVFTNLVLSLVFLAWSIALYMHRMDWAPHKNIITGEVNPESGRLYELMEEIKYLVEHRDLADARWLTDSTTLPRLFEQRNTYKQWYADQVALIRTGKDTKGLPDAEGKPVRKLERNPQDPLGLLMMNPKLRAPIVDSRGKSVLSIGEYEQLYKDLIRDLDAIQVEISKLIAENKRLTIEIAGDPEKKTKGVRGKLEDRNNYKKLWEDEIAYLRPHVVNQLINVEQQQRRLQEMQARLKELTGVAAAPAR